MKKVLKIIAYTLGGIIGFVILYFAAFFLLSHIKVNQNYKEPEDGIDIYLLSNGAHVDIVLPTKNEYKDWHQVIDYKKTPAQDSTMQYLAFGWGDKGFYLDTPTWADLRISVAFKALFYLSTTAMHTTFYPSMVESERCRKIRIGKDEYLKIVHYIENQFQRDESEQFILIPNVPLYGEYDSFYEAKDRYSLFFTCNTWTNQNLKQAGITACIWTPFEKGLF